MLLPNSQLILAMGYHVGHRKFESKLEKFVDDHVYLFHVLFFVTAKMACSLKASYLGGNGPISLKFEIYKRFGVCFFRKIRKFDLFTI